MSEVHKKEEETQVNGVPDRRLLYGSTSAGTCICPSVVCW